MQLFDAETVHKFLQYDTLITALGKMHEDDIISCVPMSNEALVKGPPLKSGSHFDFGWVLLTPHILEADDDAMRRGSVYTCCDRGREDVDELTMPLASGALHMADIKGDSFDLAKGCAPGRASPDEITVSKKYRW